ncbi:MAG: [Fe-Fe] hydrogenase large subunit C-terminal domain-containing protein [archaeon]
MKNDILKIEKIIREKECIALLAPSFIAEFDYPEIIVALKELGFKKVTELTFGAKMVNREYHEILKNKKMYISTACPGITTFIETNYPQFKDNLVKVDSPMIATAKICKKNFPEYTRIFISPCSFKKQEAESSKYIDYVIDYQQLKQLFGKNKISVKKTNKGTIEKFDCLYNDYTKIYPVAGGLSKTAHLKGVLKKNEVKIIDGVDKVKKFLDAYLKKPNKKIRFLDINFCVSGCLGGPFIGKDKKLTEKTKRIKNYMKFSKRASIHEHNKGWIKKAEGINFRKP